MGRVRFGLTRMALEGCQHGSPTSGTASCTSSPDLPKTFPLPLRNARCRGCPSPAVKHRHSNHDRGQRRKVLAAYDPPAQRERNNGMGGESEGCNRTKPHYYTSGVC